MTADLYTAAALFFGSVTVIGGILYFLLTWGDK